MMSARDWRLTVLARARNPDRTASRGIPTGAGTDPARHPMTG